MNDPVPTDMAVAAQIRIAARQGIPIVVIHRGDNNSGVLFLKINRLDGTAQVMTQVRVNDELFWAPVKSAASMTEPEADAYLERQASTDPDAWLIEIEDRQGRIWFPGRVLAE